MLRIEEFKEEFNNKANILGIKLSEAVLEKFYGYMQILLEWNEKMNLTAITDEKEIIVKHFIDSLTVQKYIIEKQTVMDIGTGAGFPGIPLKLLYEENQFILIDSLNKRIQFLEEIKKELNLRNLELIHARAEELAKNKAYRENVDVVISRAVANLRVLVEYMLPFVKANGICICMKGPNINEEIEESKNAIKILGGELIKIDKFLLPETNIERNIIIIKKIRNTPIKYPRKAGTPVKQPL